MRMASDTRELGHFHLQQPELLDENTLKHILELRCIKLQNMDSMKKEKLVEIFHRVAVPLPQRKYKENRRGKLLTRMRRKQENSRRREEPAEKSDTISYGFSNSSPSFSSPLTNVPQHRDRLKPPPGAINFERKTIKLKSSSSRSSDLDNICIKKTKKEGSSGTNGDVMNKIVIKDRRKEKEGKTQNADSTELHREKSKNPMDESKSKDEQKKEIVVRKIKLKRSHGTISSEGSSLPAPPSSGGEVKKQKSKISWP